jgi:N utilization substance protein A
MKGEFLTAINLLSNEKGVSPDVVVEALESALVSAYKRNFNDTTLNVEARIDPETGEPRVMIEKVVADEPIEPNEISLDVARGIESNASVGDTIWEDVTPKSFGRIAAQTAKQHIVQRLREAERKRVYDEFAERAGEIIHGLVQRIEQRTVILELGKTEAIMPPSEQVPTERYYPGQRIRVYLVEVHETHKGPQLLVSRAHKLIIKRLFEQEVPEIFNGTVEIKAIAREPGARSKVAVIAHQEGIDPVGSCVGMRGVRIQNIVNELGGEKIDVIPWSADPATFVAAALSPAQVQRVDIAEEEKTATVVVPERQLSLAIGREGQNARLAARLTGWRIDIKSDAALARAELEAWAGGDTAEGATVGAAAAGAAAAVTGDAPVGQAAETEAPAIPAVNEEAAVAVAVELAVAAGSEASAAAPKKATPRKTRVKVAEALVTAEPAVASEAVPEKKTARKSRAKVAEALDTAEPAAANEAVPEKAAGRKPRAKKTEVEQS